VPPVAANCNCGNGCHDVANGFDRIGAFHQLGRTHHLGVYLLSYLTSAESLVYCAVFFYVLGFLFRDELWLRGLLFIGTMFYIFYYYYAAESPLWEAMFTSGLLGLVNVSMILVVLLERSTVGMGSDAAVLYGFFQNLSPGQFRRIMKRGTLQTATRDEVLSKEGEPLTTFYFVFEGKSTIAKRGQTVEVPAGHFIGEVAFLKGGPATASVTVSKGTRYVAWKHEALRDLMQRSPNLSNGLIALLNMDMAGKVARSQPVVD